MNRRQRFKKKAKIAAAATFISASILLGASVEDAATFIDTSDDDSNHITLHEEQKVNLPETMVHRIPLVIRALCLIPMWALGNILITLLNPFKNMFLHWLLTFVIMTICFVIAVKILFPNMKLSEILTKKNIIILLVSSFLITAVNEVLVLTNKDYRHYTILIRFVLGLAVLTFMVRPFVILKRKIESIIIPDLDSI